jgi:hypothetical protein
MLAKIRLVGRFALAVLYLFARRLCFKVVHNDGHKADDEFPALLQDYSKG